MVALVTIAAGGCSQDSTAPSTVQTPPPRLATPSLSPAPAQPAPQAVAREVVTRWARPDLAAEEWWTQLQPLLAPRGLQNLAGTDPANIPRLRVLSVGAPRIENGVYAEVLMATTVGDVTVTLSRPQEGSWKVGTIELPEEIS
ncbi:hypothetical protein GCM10027425_33530 [Alteromonas gracilis]